MKRREMIQAIAGGLTAAGTGSRLIPVAHGEPTDPPLMIVIKTDRPLCSHESERIVESMLNVTKMIADRVGYCVPLVLLPPGVSVEAVSNPACSE